MALIYRLCANFTEQCCVSNILKKHIKLSLSWTINWNWTVRYLVLSANTCLYRIICAFLQAIMGTGWGLKNTPQASFDELNHLSLPAQISWPFSGEDYTLSSKRHWGPLCSHVDVNLGTWTVWSTQIPYSTKKNYMPTNPQMQSNHNLCLNIKYYSVHCFLKILLHQINTILISTL